METTMFSNVSAKVVCPDDIKRQFKPGELGIVLDWAVTDTKNGLVMPDPQTGKPNKGMQKSESFVRQFLDLLMVRLIDQSVLSPRDIRDTANVLQRIANTPQLFMCDGGAGVVTHGIVVGSNNAAVDISQYALGVLITHGVGAGQLQYGATSFSQPASDATTSQFTIIRAFGNGSGGDVTINELGLYVKAGLIGPVEVNYGSGLLIGMGFFMTIRDVITITIPNGQTLTINYRPQSVV
jgi:hypothetical protein